MFKRVFSSREREVLCSRGYSAKGRGKFCVEGRIQLKGGGSSVFKGVFSYREREVLCSRGYSAIGRGKFCVQGGIQL